MDETKMSRNPAALHLAQEGPVGEIQAANQWRGSDGKSTGPELKPVKREAMPSTHRSLIEWFYLVCLILVVVISAYVLYRAHQFVTGSVTFKKLCTIVQIRFGED